MNAFVLVPQARKVGLARRHSSCSWCVTPDSPGGLSTSHHRLISPTHPISRCSPILRRRRPRCEEHHEGFGSLVSGTTDAGTSGEEHDPTAVVVEQSFGTGMQAVEDSQHNELSFRDMYSGRLPEWLLSRLEQIGFPTPTLVQREALEVILSGENDAVLHAQTGSGKTLAFLLPLFAAVDPTRSAVQGIIIVPTRELGLQVAAVAKRLAGATNSSTGGKIQVMSVLEGSKNKRQRAWAWADPPHIVIGNPDNLNRLVLTGAIRVNAVSYVVVDEVDACLLSEATRASLHELLARSLSPTHAEDEEDEDMAGLVEVGLQISGDEVLSIRKPTGRQTVFASATVPQHNHFIRQCVQVIRKLGLR